MSSGFARLALVGVRLHRYVRMVRRASVIGPATVALGMFLLGAAVALRMAEPGEVSSFGQAVWWAIARATALGDAGIALGTPASRAIELVVVIAGLAYLSLLTAAIASVFVRSEAANPEARKLDEILERLSQLERAVSERNEPT